MDDLPRTAKEARDVGSRYYFTGAPCKHGHIAKRSTSTGNCYECGRISSSENSKKNRERRNESTRRWRENNREKYLELNRNNVNRIRLRDPEAARMALRERYRKEPEKWKERARRHRVENPEIYRDLQRKRMADPQRAAVKRALDSIRRAQKSSSTPPWLTKEHRREIAWFYAEARRLTQETGIVHHVDHIHPLQGENVCGLHVPWNLQILTATENLQKNNKLLEAA